MTREDIIRMAREAGLTLRGHYDEPGSTPQELERFAALVAAAELRRLHAESASLAAALASSCDEQRHELWESGGIAGCERARVAERQRDALLEALRALVHNEGLDAYSYLDKGIGTATAAGQRWLNARAAIKAVEEGK